MNAFRAVRFVAALALATAAVLTVGGGTAHGAPAPFGDPDAQGSIGFCSGGAQVTTGLVDARPFAASAVSTASAPPGYTPPRGRASLFVFQPRKGVDPSDWSGKQMMAPSAFTNASHPMTAATSIDPALVDFVSVFPPDWDGLIQFRLWFTAGNYPQHLRPYPAAVLQVSGNQWTQLNAPTVSCSSGRATSVEKVALPKSRFRSPPAGSTSTPPSRGVASRTSAGSASEHTTAPPVSRSGAAAESDSPAAGVPTSDPAVAPGAATKATPPAASAANASSSGTSAATLWSVVGAVVLLAVGAVGVLRRRRRAGPR